MTSCFRLSLRVLDSGNMIDGIYLWSPKREMWMAMARRLGHDRFDCISSTHRFIFGRIWILRYLNSLECCHLTNHKAKSMRLQCSLNQPMRSQYTLHGQCPLDTTYMYFKKIWILVHVFVWTISRIRKHLVIYYFIWSAAIPYMSLHSRFSVQHNIIAPWIEVEVLVRFGFKPYFSIVEWLSN